MCAFPLGSMTPVEGKPISRVGRAEEIEVWHSKVFTKYRVT